jgi:hypothetical protein
LGRRSAGVGVGVGGTGVFVGSTGVFVGSTAVFVGGADVFIASIEVAVDNRAVLVSVGRCATFTEVGEASFASAVIVASMALSIAARSPLPLAITAVTITPIRPIIATRIIAQAFDEPLIILPPLSHILMISSHRHLQPNHHKTIRLPDAV